MNCYLVDTLYWLTEAFGGNRIWNYDIKLADGATIFAYLGKEGKLQIDQGIYTTGRFKNDFLNLNT